MTGTFETPKTENETEEEEEEEEVQGDEKDGSSYIQYSEGNKLASWCPITKKTGRKVIRDTIGGGERDREAERCVLRFHFAERGE
jgi:hypothetical protein